MKSLDFRKQREATWLELEGLVRRVERSGLGSLSAGDLERLPALYRATLSSLSVARAISLDRNVLDYLESLAARAYFCVYGSGPPLLRAAGDFLSRRWPRAVRRFRRHVVLAAALTAAGTLAGLMLMRSDPNHFYALVDEAYAQGRGPASSTEDLRKVLYHSGGAADRLTVFATFLFTHNARVGMLAAALGFVAALPTLLLLFQNGLVLGAFGGLYAERGLGPEFWAWVLPHGVTELTAVVFCGAAGLAVGEGLLFPGRHTRLAAMAQRGREAAVLVVGSVLMFFVAGLIEGIFRQTVHDVALRALVALLSAAFWAVYFVLGGREGRA
jgi:uncharacterized membrane protein SpoIIM required for sporulation